jgi:CheY-like chemotaxis protein/signal transduction histidine kinase
MTSGGHDRTGAARGRGPRAARAATVRAPAGRAAAVVSVAGTVAAWLSHSIAEAAVASGRAPALAAAQQGAPFLQEALALLAIVALAAVGVLAMRLRRERARRAIVDVALARERAARAAALERRGRHHAALRADGRAALVSIDERAALLEAGHAGAAARPHAAALRSVVRRLAEDLDALVEYDAIDDGRIAARPRDTDVVALLREVAARAAAQTADRRLAFTVSLSQQPFPPVAVDPLRLRQIAEALVRDAIARADRGEVHVALGCRLPDAPRRHGLLALDVRDDGPAPDPTALSRLQAALDGDPVAPADGNEPVDGPGFGAWRAARLARALGGSLRLGTDGRGLQRELRLPLRLGATVASTDRASDAGGHPAKADPAQPAGPARRGRLLLVEDDRVVQFTLEHQLERAGYDVVCADDAEEAIAAWLAEPAPRMVTDLGLPGRDGIALIGAIRDAERARGTPRTRIVVLTGEPGRGERARAAGADAVLPKPADVESMVRALQPAPAQPAPGRGGASVERA